MLTSVMDRENVLTFKPNAFSLNLYQSKWEKKIRGLQMLVTGDETAVVFSPLQVTDNLREPLSLKNREFLKVFPPLPGTLCVCVESDGTLAPVSSFVKLYW